MQTLPEFLRLTEGRSVPKLPAEDRQQLTATELCKGGSGLNA